MKMSAIMCGTCNTEMRFNEVKEIQCPNCKRVATDEEIQRLLRQGFEDCCNSVKSKRAEEWVDRNLIFKDILSIKSSMERESERLKTFGVQPDTIKEYFKRHTKKGRRIERGKSGNY